MSVLAACGGDSTPSGSTTPPAGGLAIFTASECANVAVAMAAALSGGLAGAGGNPSTESVDSLRRMAAGAPAAVKADIEKVAAALQKFYADLQAAGVDFTNPSTLQDPQKAAALAQAASAFEASGAKQAIDNIQAYFDQLCPGVR